MVRAEVGSPPGERGGQHTRDHRDPERPCGPHRATTGAPSSGPRTAPLGDAPESRHGAGPERNGCSGREVRLAGEEDTEPEGPSRRTASASTHKEGAKRARAHAAASASPASTSARRSPIRSTRTPAGTAAANSATVVIPTKSAARPTEAPSPRALSATTGSTAPAPIDQMADGPNAGTAMRRSEKSSSALHRPSFLHRSGCRRRRAG